MRYRNHVIDLDGWVVGNKLHFVEVENYRAVCGAPVDPSMPFIQVGTILSPDYPARFCARCWYVLRSRKRQDRADEVG